MKTHARNFHFYCVEHRPYEFSVNPNYGYNGNATMKTFQLCFGSERPATMTELIVVKDMFVTFDKSTGTFIPKDEYKAYGAQR